MSYRITFGLAMVTLWSLLWFSITPFAGAALPQIEPQQIPKPILTFPHQVLGTLKKPNNCTGNLTITLNESWYIPSNTSIPPALAPANNTVTGFQNRTLATAPIDPNTGNFVLNWSEFKGANRMPWGTGTTTQGQATTVYRFLTLLVTGQSIIGVPQPQVLIQFLGNESSKDLRTVTVNCSLIGG
jgi:hypothetical protein